MKVPALLAQWESTAKGELTQEEYCVQLTVQDAARLKALAELYPRRSINNLITELLSAALDDVESSMPYVRGETVVATDEQGDPLYEDVGPTPRYLSLTQKYLDDLQSARESAH